MTGALLANTALFRGASPQEAEAMLNCLGAVERSYCKGERICRSGDYMTDLGMVLSGSVLIQTDDLWGNTTVLDKAGPGQIFAETYACVPGEPLMVDVVAAEAARVLFLKVERVLHVCSHTCAHHSKLIRNLLLLSAQKNLNLSRKIFHTSAKTIRGRLLSYLSYQARRSGGPSFSIPFNRQQLADYLNVERSALSNELSKMQRDGLIRLEKNQFTLIQDVSGLSSRV